MIYFTTTTLTGTPAGVADGSALLFAPGEFELVCKMNYISRDKIEKWTT